MTGGGNEAMQVIYMEVEGIKLAYQMSKDGAKLGLQLMKFILSSLAELRYKKTAGRTNRKNMWTRADANGQSKIPVQMDQKAFRQFHKMAKKYGILYTAFKPLKSGNEKTMQIMIQEKDLIMVQELLSRIKEARIKEDVKNGMEEEQSGKLFDFQNHPETMDEFAKNVGAASDKAVFEEDMRERFGEDYEEKIVDFIKYAKEREPDPKGKTAGVDKKKINSLADVIQFKERASFLRERAPVEIRFVYDEKQGKSQIMEETETHVKVAGKGIRQSEKPEQWESIWIPKNAILPPLDREAGEEGIRTARLPVDEVVVVEDPAGRKEPEKIKASELYQEKKQDAGAYVAERMSYASRSTVPEKAVMDITVSKQLIREENSRAVKTRVPGTWGKDVRYLWINRKNMMEVYGGKSILTSLEKDKNYKLYSADNEVVETKKGSDLYREHYDAVAEKVRKRAQMSGGAGMGKGRRL